MFDDFFIRALVAGVGVAFVTGPLGCFVIWRRLSYFGDTLAHSALLGVTLAFTMEFNIALSVFIISSLIALTLIQLQKRTNLPGDALLGLLAHSSLAVGLVVIGFLTFIRFDIMGLLFGDILAVTVDANKGFQISLRIKRINAPPIHMINKSSTVTASMSPNNNPIISNLINVKKPITTSPTARDEWAKRPNKASPGRLVLFWSCIKDKAIKEEIKNTDKAMLNSIVKANVTPNRAEWAKVSPK